MFSISNEQEFFQKVLTDFSVFQEQSDSPSLAINCILSLYHLHEWVWARNLKRNEPVKAALEINDKAGFLAWLDQNHPYFSLLQELANGTKHCAPVHSTKRVAGYGMGPYGIGPYGAPYLLIDLGDLLAGKDRYLTVCTILPEMVDFWQQFFDAHLTVDEGN